MSKQETYRDFLQCLIDEGLTDYGAVIPKQMVYELLGIEVPEVGTQRQFNEIALTELAAVDYVRAYLLNKGKYLAGTTSGYRVLLPSENVVQVESYVSQADKKLSRALKLSRNTPRPADNAQVDQQEARVLMRQEGIRERFGNGH
jgi:hypothetical protein